MEIEVIKKIIQDNIKGIPSRNARIRKAEMYYANENDILRRRNPVESELRDKNPENPLRNADNRVSHPWHQLLVDQKAAYTMTEPPTFDVGDDELNNEIVKLLGDDYPKVAKDLCIEASNAGIAWLHVWRDEDYKNFFRYAVVKADQIIPIYSKKLNNKLEGLLRVYETYSEAGEVITIYEYWNDNECSMYSKPKSKTIDDLSEYLAFEIEDISTGEPLGATNVYQHGWHELPFIPFRNNPTEQSDLKKYKKLIDVYDKVYSGFVNDIDDIQEIIFVLTNYSGEDKKEFLNDLKQFKMVQVEDDGDGTKGGLDTLAIEIPVEARDKVLQITRESIFTHGQGVDPQRNIGQNNSGAALKYMYSLLELKASMLETEFRIGFATLVRFILAYSDRDSDITIRQTWKRSAINNDLEQADIVAKLAPVTSKEAIAKSNPIVENWSEEITALENELIDSFRATDDYRPIVEEDDVVE